MALTADWTYLATNERAGRVNDTYTADYSKRHDLTEVMAMDTTLRCSSRSNAEVTQQNVIPSLSFLINNDIFSFNLSGTDDEEFSNGEQGDRSNRSWGADLNSVWGHPVWWLPAMNFNANQQWLDDAQDPSLQDSSENGAGGRLDWDLGLGRLFYNYNTHHSNNTVTGNTSDSHNYMTRFETDASFGEGLGLVTFSQQIASTTTDTLARLTDGVALIPVPVTAYHAEADPTPVTLGVNAPLTDGDTDVTAISVNNPVHPMNLGVRINFQQVERIYLYTETALSSTVAAQFTWDLYTSNNNLDWTLVQHSVSAVYNSIERRFEFVIPGYTKEFVKLVAVDAPAITTVNFTEVQAWHALTGSGSEVAITDKLDSYQTDATMNLQLRSDLQLTSSVGYQRSNSATGYDTTSTGINTGLNWNPDPDWSVQLNGNQNRRNRPDAINDETRTYGVSVGFPTIPTVDSMFGVSLSEYFEDARKTNTGTDLTLQFIAELYRDLSGKLNFDVANQKDFVTGEDTKTVSTRVGLTARLVPGLVADWTTSVSDSSNQSATVSSDALMTWRYTENLSLRGNLTGSWGGTEVMNLAGGFDLGLTETMQVSLTQRREITPESYNITYADWRWTITQNVSMLASGAFLYGGDRDEWNVISRLSTRFATF